MSENLENLTMGLIMNNEKTTKVKLNTLKEHPQNNIIYGGEEIEELAAKIKANNYIRPLIITEDGTVLSGNRRKKACELLGIEEVPVEIRKFSHSLDDLQFLLSENEYRMKTMEQKIREARVYERIEAERTKLKELAGIAAANNPIFDDSAAATENKKEVENFPQAKTRDVIAKKAAIGSGRTYEKAKHVVNKIDDLKMEGKVDEAKQLSEILSKSVDRAYNEIRRKEKLELVEQRIQSFKKNPAPTGFVDIYNTDKRYNIIYADPCWSYQNDRCKSANMHYKVMTIEDICALPVKNIAAENCILFLWVTHPILPDAFTVIKNWGFHYSTCGFCWVKKNKHGGDFFGLGNWTRANSELCLIATKGVITRLDNTISQIVETEIEHHSKKPDIVRDLIVRLVGDLPKIELFARQAPMGWDVWGNEVK